jgi:hypothetical protein
VQVLGAVSKPLTARPLERLLTAYRPPPGAAASADAQAAIAALVTALDAAR